MRICAIALPFTMLAGCVAPEPLGPVGDGPTFALVSGTGDTVGAVQVESTANGNYLRIAVQGLPPGEHGLHLHAAGICEGPAFQSAGAHWNPGSRQHGHLNPHGAHAGDLPNITVSANGRGALNFLVADGDLADSDGTSLVIHAGPDDYRTDPSGNSGDRIACAVLSAPRP